MTNDTQPALHLMLAVPMPPPLPEFVGPRQRSYDAGRGVDLERALGRALGRAYPWLLEVSQPFGAGMLWACWAGEHEDAANDPLAVGTE